MRSFVTAAFALLMVGVLPASPAWADGYDDDYDGVPNASDICEDTPYEEVEAPFAGVVNPNAGPHTGCSIWQICACGGPMGTDEAWENKGEYISCVSDTAGDFADLGLIPNNQRGRVVAFAGVNGCIEVCVGGNC